MFVLYVDWFLKIKRLLKRFLLKMENKELFHFNPCGYNIADRCISGQWFLERFQANLDKI